MKIILEEKVCEISWKDFWIEDICEIKSGVRLTKANQEIGLRPFVGASDSDNGVTAFVSNKNKGIIYLFTQLQSIVTKFTKILF